MSGPTSVREFPKPCAAQKRRPSFLLICDEWSPTKGGISQFNRSLATALAAAGHRTVCLVKFASAQEFQDASARGVTLRVAERTPDGPNLYVPSDAVLAEPPDVVIGHDIVSGSVALIYARRYLRAALVFVIHTPPRIEHYKRDCDASERTENRERRSREIGAEADVVAAVGPRLARTAETLVSDGYGAGTNSVLQLDPGIDVPVEISGQLRSVPASPTVLVLGRGTHVQAKGLDIAAQAVAGLVPRHGQPPAELFIQGASPDGADTLRQTLIDVSGLSRDRIDVRAFTNDPSQIQHSLRRAAVCVMPSRLEGFGLASLEAIAQGTPVLVSAKSGLAETLRAQLGILAEPMIVDVTDDLAQDVLCWRSAIQRVLDDLPQAFTYTHLVRDRLRQALRWDTTVDALVERLALPAVPAAALVSHS